MVGSLLGERCVGDLGVRAGCTTTLKVVSIGTVSMLDCKALKYVQEQP